MSKIYKTYYTIKWKEDKIEKSYTSWNFYILPMLRFIYHGSSERMLQFRWLIWGINFRFK